MKSHAMVGGMMFELLLSIVTWKGAFLANKILLGGI